MALAKEKQDRIAKPSQRVVGELGVPGVKYSMDVNGYFGGFLSAVAADCRTET